MKKRRKLTADKLARSLRHGSLLGDPSIEDGPHYLPPTVRKVQLAESVVLEAKLARIGKL